MIIQGVLNILSNRVFGIELDVKVSTKNAVTVLPRDNAKIVCFTGNANRYIFF